MICPHVTLAGIMVHIWVRGKVSEKSTLYSLVKILDYLLPPCVEQPIVPHSNQVFFC